MKPFLALLLCTVLWSCRQAPSSKKIDTKEPVKVLPAQVQNISVKPGTCSLYVDKGNLYLTMTLVLDKKSETEVESVALSRVESYGNGRLILDLRLNDSTPESHTLLAEFLNGKRGTTLETKWVYEPYKGQDPSEELNLIETLVLNLGVIQFKEKEKDHSDIYEGNEIRDMDRFLDLMEEEVKKTEEMVEKAGSDPIKAMNAVGTNLSFYQQMVTKNARKLRGNQYERYTDLSGRYIAALNKMTRNLKKLQP